MSLVHLSRNPDRVVGPEFGQPRSSPCLLCTHQCSILTTREYVREPAAEFLGVMILVIFGNGAACQTTLSSNTRVSSSPAGVSSLFVLDGDSPPPLSHSCARYPVLKNRTPHTDLADATLQDALAVDFGFAVGLSLGAWVTSGISAGHINPAVTIAMATFRRDFPWRKVPAYIFAQLMGGLCGAGIVYANYIHAIDLVEGGRHIRTVPGTASLFATYAVRSTAFVLSFLAG